MRECGCEGCEGVGVCVDGWVCVYVGGVGVCMGEWVCGECGVYMEGGKGGH